MLASRARAVAAAQAVVEEASGISNASGVLREPVN